MHSTWSAARRPGDIVYAHYASGKAPADQVKLSQDVSCEKGLIRSDTLRACPSTPIRLRARCLHSLFQRRACRAIQQPLETLAIGEWSEEARKEEKRLSLCKQSNTELQRKSGQCTASSDPWHADRSCLKPKTPNAKIRCQKDQQSTRPWALNPCVQGRTVNTDLGIVVAVLDGGRVRIRLGMLHGSKHSGTYGPKHL